ncbi:hypothetical protein GCM10010174_41570 [Kutzneria viridogrisea]|uniref:Beta-lactamase class A n=1 Tax=Kutzneria viridogrisea TaxID=47990 RepID=A0ABR6BMP4_9PSEU|nr:beta-lactamase class A [Kutzneria viridogrisea]
MRKLALICALALTALLGTTPGALAAPPTTAVDQLRWFVDATNRAPISDSELQHHFSPGLLNAAGGTAGINATFTQLGPLEFGQVKQDQPNSAAATATGGAGEILVTVHTDTNGLLDGLRPTPVGPTPTSWSQLDSQLRAFDSRVSYTSSVIDSDGRCHEVHGVNANTQRPLGSAFKLYVLGALGQAVTEHKASWDEKLAIREDWKSLPSGVLQNSPAGTEYTLAQYADYMISLSDNTATDHLIHRLGTAAVERQLFRFGNSRPSATIPFMTTRNLFVLKGIKTDAELDQYLALSRPAKAAALRATEQVPLSLFTMWTKPKKIDQVEWFASPNDLCRAYAGLLGMNQPQIDHALSINDAGLSLDHAQYPTVWFKGGSEPGVLTLNYLVRDNRGRTVVSNVLLSNPSKGFSPVNDAFKGINIARGGIQLALR